MPPKHTSSCHFVISQLEAPFIKPFMIEVADDHYTLDLTRARTILGWEPHHTLHDTISLMRNALKHKPEQLYRENHLSIISQLEHTEGFQLTGIATPG